MRHAWLAIVSAVVACANANPDDASLAVSLTSIAIAVGQSAMVQASSERGSVIDVSWDIGDPTIATVVPGNAGAATITGVAIGSTTAIVQLGNVRRTIDVTVGAAAIDGLTVGTMNPMVPAGLTSQLVAMAHYTDGTTSDVSDMANWITANDQVATVDAHGLVAAVGVGSADISARIMDTKGVVTIAVTDAALQSIAIAQPATIAKGLTAQLAAIGTYTDGTTIDITSSVTWSSTNEAAAPVDSTGLVRGVAMGSAEIDAVKDDVSGSAAVEVGPAIVVSIVVTPSSLSLDLGRSQPLVATGTYSDGPAADVTSLATWTVATGAAVTVNPAGIVHAIAQGPATVSATIGAAMGSIDVTVGPAVADHLSLSTGNLVIARAQLVPVRATLVLSDDSTQDVTATATWQSSMTGVATIAGGVVTGVATGGPATITAMASGQSAQVTATVTSATCHPVINEVQAGGSDGADEWVELFNPCATEISVAGWTLVYRSANAITGNDTNTLQTLTDTMQPGAFRLYAGQDYGGTFDGVQWGGGTSGLLQKNDGAIGLRSGPASSGPLVDSVAYGNVMPAHPFIEGVGAPALANNLSVARRPFDGNDTNANNMDFLVVAAPTPRASNAP